MALPALPFIPRLTGPLPASRQGPSQLASLENDFMARLFGNEQANLSELTRTYIRATQSMIPLWKEAYRKLQWAKQQGFDDNYLSGYIWSEQRMATILSQLAARMTELGTITGQALAFNMTEAAQLAQQSVIEYTNQQILEAGGFVKRGGVTVDFASAPHAELELLTARLGDGSPIIESLARQFGAVGADIARGGMLAGLANGDNPAQLARRLAAQMGAHAGKTAVIFRTEMMRVYRDTGLLTMRANAKFIRGWTWISALSDTTCPLCWAMHGSEHGLDERMETHPACRCSQRPLLRPWGEINPLLAGATQPPPEPNGNALFRKLGPDAQRRVLGPKLYGAYTEGRIKLGDIPKRTYSPKWGGGRRAASASELLGGKQGPATPPKPAPKPAPKPQPIVPAVAAPKAPVAPTAPAKPTGPKGIPVSQHLQTAALPKSGKSGAIAGHMRETIKIIDQTHGDGQLAPVPIKLNQRAGAYGQYVSRYGGYVNATNVTSQGDFRRKLEPDKLELSAKVGGSHPRNTFAHELGHYIDQQHFGRRPGEDFTTGYGSEISPKLEAWEIAVKGSRAIRALDTLLLPGSQIPYTLAGETRMMGPDRKYIRYTLTNREIFARSYAQYIATKSQDPVMLAELNAMRDPLKAYHQTQWADDDFAPIAKAFDDLFRGEGWLE